MTYEITKVELFGQNRDGDQISATVASSAKITKGTLLVLSDPRTVAANTSGLAHPIFGISSEEKDYDFSTRMTAWNSGVFEAYASGTITVNNPVCTTYVDINKLQSAIGVAAASHAAIVGYALETASDGEKFTFIRKGVGA